MHYCVWELYLLPVKNVVKVQYRHYNSITIPMSPRDFKLHGVNLVFWGPLLTSEKLHSFMPRLVFRNQQQHQKEEGKKKQFYVALWGDSSNGSDFQRVSAWGSERQVLTSVQMKVPKSLVTFDSTGPQVAEVILAHSHIQHGSWWSSRSTSPLPQEHHVDGQVLPC